MTKPSIAIRSIAILGISALWFGCDTTEPVTVTADRAEFRLEPAGPTDIQGGPLVTDADLAHAVNFERAPISRSWQAGAELAAEVTPHVASSRHYRVQVSGRELASGVALSLTAPRALIQVATRPGSDAAAHALAEDDVALIAADGRSYSGHQAMDAIISAEDMQDSELPFARGTTFMRMRPARAPADYTLRVEGLEQYQDDVVITVLEPESEFTFALTSSANTYLQGQELLIDAHWSAGDALPETRSLHATVRSPTGARKPIELEAAGPGAFRGRMALDDADVRPGELWEVAIDVMAENHQGQTVRRSVVTAFAYARTTATLSGRVAMEAAAGDDLRLAFAADIGSSGRYALTGVLMGTDSEGAMRPVAVAQSAAFLEAGAGELTLAFDRGLIDSAGVSAPYEVRDLRLLDQTRMGLLHRQAQAVAIPNL